MKYHTLFLSKIAENVTNLSSAAVVICALRVNIILVGWKSILRYAYVKMFSGTRVFEECCIILTAQASK